MLPFNTPTKMSDLLILSICTNLPDSVLTQSPILSSSILIFILLRICLVISHHSLAASVSSTSNRNVTTIWAFVNRMYSFVQEVALLGAYAVKIILTHSSIHCPLMRFYLLCLFHRLCNLVSRCFFLVLLLHLGWMPVRYLYRPVLIRFAIMRKAPLLFLMVHEKLYKHFDTLLKQSATSLTAVVNSLTSLIEAIGIGFEPSLGTK